MSAYADTYADKQATQTSDQLNAMPENIDALADVVSQLENRLQDVLRGDDTLAKDTLGSPEEVLVPVAHKLRSANERINIIRSQVTSMLNRLEL